MEKLIGYEVIEHEVRKIIEITTLSGQMVINKPHHCFFKCAKLSLDDGVVKLFWQDYLGNPLPYEPIAIRISGESALGEALLPAEGIYDDGIIDLSEYVAGDKLVIESMAENMENAKIEVVV